MVKYSFIENTIGRQEYPKDSKGNEKYPRRKNNLFARDENGNYFYAKDKDGNEYHPTRDKISVFITDPITKEMKLALYANKTQRYPNDGKGNEYYLTKDGKPYLLRNTNGKPYLARSRKGIGLIPWNHISEFIDDKPFLNSTDSVGNSIYLNESETPEIWQFMLRCICRISIICPKHLPSCINI